MPTAPTTRSRVLGCLLGGAVGDALGGPIEFMHLVQIRHRFGEDGMRDMVMPYPRHGRVGAVTDDTQMTLFTAEGLLHSGMRGTDPAHEVHAAYLRWYYTQTHAEPPQWSDGVLGAQPWLYARRAPGATCMSGLANRRMGTPSQPKNPQSKGCGTVMRSAPFGLHPSSTATDAYELAATCAAQTHGHPTGIVAAGAMAAIVRRLLGGHTINDAVIDAANQLDRLGVASQTSETLDALRRAHLTHGYMLPTAETMEYLGGGWVAEEALALGVLAALHGERTGDLRGALLLAVNHGGDSDSTGSVAGNLLGARFGVEALPADWVAKVEGRRTVTRLTDAWMRRRNVWRYTR